MRLGACLREIELLQLWPKLFLNLDRPLGLLEGVPRIAGIFLSELSGSFANWADMGWDFFRHDGLSGAPPSSSAPRAGRSFQKCGWTPGCHNDKDTPAFRRALLDDERDAACRFGGIENLRAVGFAVHSQPFGQANDDTQIVYERLALLREWLEGIDRICREVWQIQGKVVTPDFVNLILLPKAFALIETRKGSIASYISRAALRTGDSTNPPRAHHLLAMEINALKSGIRTKYEIEARTLEHKQALQQSERGSSDEADYRERPGTAQSAKGKSSNSEGLVQPGKISKLGPKEMDMSRYLDSPSLTDQQRQCLSLKMEYSLGVAEIARRLSLHHSTVQEHLKAGERALQHDQSLERRKKRRAIDPGSQSEV